MNGSGPFNNGTIDYDGSIPGWRQGNTAGRPALGSVRGDLYLDNQAQILYWWDGAAWQQALAGGGGGAQDLQSVLTVGNQTTLDILSSGNLFFAKPAGTEIAVLTFQGGHWLFGIGDPTFTNTVSFGLAGTTFKSATGSTNLSSVVPVGTNNIQFPNASGINQVSGRVLQLPTKGINASYVLTELDNTLLCDVTGGSIIITLPDPNLSIGMVYIVKNQFIALTRTITLTPVAGSVDGSPSLVVSAATRASVMVQSDGSNWWILAQF